MIDFDQDHYGGVAAVDLLATKAGISSQHRLLDVCSGMGGPARWIAHRIGCRVTGLDLTQSRVDGASRLTKRVELDHLVDFVQGNATAMPFPDFSYDGVLAFTDIVARGQITPEAQARLGAEMQYASVEPAANYIELLKRSQFEVVTCEDLSEQWAAILTGRLEMYRSLRDTTVAKFGEARYAEYDHAYSNFVGLIVTKELNGVRIVARRFN